MIAVSPICIWPISIFPKQNIVEKSIENKHFLKLNFNYCFLNFFLGGHLEGFHPKVYFFYVLPPSSLKNKFINFSIKK